MPVDPLFHGTMKDGKFFLKDRAAFERYMGYTFPEGSDVSIVPKKTPKSGPTDKLRGYYFRVICVILGDIWGYPPPEAHEAIKGHYLRKPGKNGAPDTVGSTAPIWKDYEMSSTWIKTLKDWGQAEWGVTKWPHKDDVDYNDGKWDPKDFYV